jgi:acetoin utilization deacetylase AcuC-like enzyme
MLTIHSDAHRLHHGAGEFYRGRIVPCFEMPARVEQILASVTARGLGAVVAPKAHGRAPLERVHAGDYLDFLASAWDEWTALGETGDALPYAWPARDLRADRAPDHIDGKLGFYSIDAAVPITAGTWQAVQASADCALTGAAAVLGGERAALPCAARPATMPGRAQWGLLLPQQRRDCRAGDARRRGGAGRGARRGLSSRQWHAGDFL